MAARRVTEPKGKTTPRRRPPATTPEAREGQLIALAVDLVEKKLIEGTASSQEITHLLKLGSSREKAEQEKMKLEQQVLAAKIETMESTKRIEEKYDAAIAAMRSYAGYNEPTEVHDD